MASHSNRWCEEECRHGQCPSGCETVGSIIIDKADVVPCLMAGKGSAGEIVEGLARRFMIPVQCALMRNR